jgi:hypothetical protein
MKSGRGWKLRRWLIAAAALIVFLLTGFLALPWLMMIPAQPSPSDGLLHLAINHHSESNAYVAELYRQGLIRKVICVSSPIAREVYPADYARQYLIAQGVREEDVSALHLPVADCAGEVMPRLVEEVKARGWRSALLVVSPSSSRFTARLARRYFGAAGVSVAITYSPQDRQELLDWWWRTHWKARRIVSSGVSATLDLLYPQCR